MNPFLLKFFQSPNIILLCNYSIILLIVSYANFNQNLFLIIFFHQENYFGKRFFLSYFLNFYNLCYTHRNTILLANLSWKPTNYQQEKLILYNCKQQKLFLGKDLDVPILKMINKQIKIIFQSYFISLKFLTKQFNFILIKVHLFPH